MYCAVRTYCTPNWASQESWCHSCRIFGIFGFILFPYSITTALSLWFRALSRYALRLTPFAFRLSPECRSGPRPQGANAGMAQLIWPNVHEVYVHLPTCKLLHHLYITALAAGPMGRRWIVHYIMPSTGQLRTRVRKCERRWRALGAFHSELRVACTVLWFSAYPPNCYIPLHQRAHLTF